MKWFFSKIKNVNSFDKKIDEIEELYKSFFKEISVLQKELSHIKLLIDQKNKKLDIVEKALISNKQYINEDTKLFNKEFYYDILRNNIDHHNYIVLTIEVKDYNYTSDHIIVKRIATVVHKFTFNTEMIGILWEDNIIKIFMYNNNVGCMKQKLIPILSNYNEYNSKNKKIIIDTRPFCFGSEI